MKVFNFINNSYKKIPNIYFDKGKNTSLKVYSKKCFVLTFIFSMQTSNQVHTQKLTKGMSYECLRLSKNCPLKKIPKRSQKPTRLHVEKFTERLYSICAPMLQMCHQFQNYQYF